MFVHARLISFSKILTLAAVAIGCGLEPQPSEESGIAEDQAAIIGGYSASNPQVGAVFIGGPDTRLFCSVVLVAPKVVLTAAHCLDHGTSNLAVTFSPRLTTVAVDGDRFISVVDPGVYNRSTPVVEFWRDPEWTGSNFAEGHDFALLKLAAPSRTVPAPLHTAPITPKLFGSTVGIFGYGETDHDGSTFTAGAVRSASAVRLHGYAYADDAQTITAPRVLQIGDSNAQACFGDSGGPAYLRVGGQNRLIGIFSYVYDGPEGQCYRGGGYGRLDLEWPLLRPVIARMSK